jgi:hypothetical protein
MSPRDEGERIVALETRVAIMDEHIKEMKAQVKDLHDLMMQAKGARWAILAVASAGGFVAGIGAKLLPFLGR